MILVSFLSVSSFSNVTLGNKRANEIYQEFKVNESTAFKIASAESYLERKLHINSGRRSIKKQLELLEGILKISKDKYGFSKKIIDGFRICIEDRYRFKSGWEATLYIKSIGGSALAQREIRRLRYRIASSHESKHVRPGSAVDIRNTKRTMVVIRRLKKFHDFKEVKEFYLDGKRTNFTHLELINTKNSIGELRLLENRKV